MLVPMRLAPGIADGSVTVLLRRWKRRQAIVGHRYRTTAGILEVDEVDLIGVADITEADALAAGAADVATAIGELRGPDDLPVTRVRFHVVHEPDPRAVLASTDALTDEDVAAIDRRLERMDRAAAHGPWTLATLQAIAARPEVRAGDLARGRGPRAPGVQARHPQAQGARPHAELPDRLPALRARRGLPARGAGDRRGPRRRRRAGRSPISPRSSTGAS